MHSDEPFRDSAENTTAGRLGSLHNDGPAQHVHAARERDLARFVRRELDRDRLVERQIPPDVQRRERRPPSRTSCRSSE